MTWPSLTRQRGAAAAIVLAAAVLVGVIWYGTASSLRTTRTEALAWASAELANEALVFADRVEEHLATLDTTLRLLERQLEANPDTFDPTVWRQRVALLSDPGVQVLVTDPGGVVRVSTAHDLVGRSVDDRRFFNHWAQAPADNGHMFIGRATANPAGSGWSLFLSRRLDLPDGTFAGVVAIAYDADHLTRFFRRGDLGRNGVLELVQQGSGVVQAAVGGGARPGDDNSASAMLQGLRASQSGRWIGPSAADGIERVHVLKALRDRGLDVVLAMPVDEALISTAPWVRDALLLSTLATLLVLALAIGLLLGARAARRRVAALARDRAMLAAAKADADAKSARLEATLAGMSDGVMMMDADFRMVEWNGRFAEILGLPRSVLWRGAPMAAMLHAQAEAGEFGPLADLDAEVERRLAVLRDVAESLTFERTRPDGRVIQVKRRRLADGGFISIFTDITERKRDEEALRQARFLAEATSEAKSRFVATVSHEIRQPLNALLNSLSLMASGDQPPPARRLLATARQSGEALLGLLNDVLEMSKMEAGQLTLRPVTFAFRPLLQGVVDIFSDQAAARGMVLALAVAPEVPERLHADPVRIRQILVNFINNAVKFADPGRVLLSAACASEAPSGGGGTLRLSVRDPGPAIDPASRTRLFQPFVQLGSTPAGGDAGTGLGLTVCRTLAGLLGGEIGYEATEDGGNVFWVTVAFTAADADAPPEAVPRPIHPRTRILLAEDLRANQFVVARLLRRAGHMVDVVGSGSAAIRAVAREPYDVVLMDVRMPGMTGIEATRHIRALPGAAGRVPICALTGDVSSADWAIYQAAGMDDVLGKPVELNAMLAMLGRLVWRGRPAAAADAPTAAAAPEEGLPAVLDSRLAELRANLSPAVLSDLVAQAIDELATLLPLLRAALDAGDAPGIAAHAHAMAGLAGSYALAALEYRAHTIVEAARAGGAGRAVGIAGDLEALLAEASVALRDAAGGVPAE